MRDGGLLEGKRTLVVGGGSGIGRAVVDAYLGEGAVVAVLEWSEDKSHRLADALPDCLVHCGDARSVSDCESIVRACCTEFGGIDVLVSCVGIFDFYKGINDIAGEDLGAACAELMSFNVLGQLAPVKAAVEDLTRSRGTAILTGSSSSFYPGRSGILYSASKYAIRGCVSALAHELAPNVRVNGVAPGGTIQTDISGPRSLGLDRQKVPQGRAREEDLRALTPLQMVMTPSDHAASYVFLASEGARGMTGSFLHSDGGMAVRG